MSLFVCDECGCVDNTALTRYWKAKREGTPRLGSKCDPEIEQHHHFPLIPWDGVRDVIGRDDFA